MRLIDADALVEDLIFPTKQFEKGFKETIGDAPTIDPSIIVGGKHPNWTIESAFEYLQNCGWMAEHDIVEVVRCKDCKHNSLKRMSGNTYCDLGMGLFQLYDFCSLGERRTDADE